MAFPGKVLAHVVEQDDKFFCVADLASQTMPKFSPIAINYIVSRDVIVVIIFAGFRVCVLRELPLSSAILTKIGLIRNHALTLSLYSKASHKDNQSLSNHSNSAIQNS